MSLKVGIVGLPNVGKSTLFNALLKKQASFAEAEHARTAAGQTGSGGGARVGNFPFTTIDPNVGIVPVPDDRLKRLSQVIKESERVGHLPPEVPATLSVVDIAGLVEGAHKGEGLGNKFLAHIREVDAIAHVVRAFEDEGVIRAGSLHPKQDFETINTELALADLQTLENQKEPKGAVSKEEKQRWAVVLRLRDALGKGIAARDVLQSEEEKREGKILGLLTAKPILVILNVDEGNLTNGQAIADEFIRNVALSEQVFDPEAQTRGGDPLNSLNSNQVIVICAKIEAELADLSEEEQRSYLSDLGVSQSGLERLAQKAYQKLGLISFLTAGEKEVRAWTIEEGTRAQDAAGVIHTDFISKFIKAEVIKFEDFVSFGGWKKAREQGKTRLEGRDYIIQDGDVVEFKIGT